MEATLAYLAVLSLGMNSGSGSTAANASVVGTWKVQLSQEVKDVARKLGAPEPQAQIVFNADNTFQYSSATSGAKNDWKGTYQVRDHTVSLLCGNPNWPTSGLNAELSDSKHLTVDGLGFVRLAAVSVVGTWTVRTDSGSENRSIKIVFKKDGSFVFSSPNATSSGSYRLDGGQIFLKWTEVDGAPVEFDMHKTLPLADDGSSFRIDSFRYEKLSGA